MTLWFVALLSVLLLGLPDMLAAARLLDDAEAIELTRLLAMIIEADAIGRAIVQLRQRGQLLAQSATDAWLKEAQMLERHVAEEM